MKRLFSVRMLVVTVAAIVAVPGVAQATTPAYPGLTGGGTVSAPTQVATGIGSNFDITDSTSVGWSSVTATVTTNRGTLTANAGDSGATVDVASNTITISGSMANVEKVLNSQGTAFARLAQDSVGSATVTVTVRPSPEFTIGGVATYFFSGNGHYYRINTSLRNWTQVNTDAQGTTVAGAPGYVGVVQTQAEDDFLRDTILPDVTGPDVSARQVWLGADRGSTNLSVFGCPAGVLTTAFTWVPGTNAPIGDRNVNVSPACATAQTNLAWKPWYPGEPTNSGLEVRLAYFDIGTWAWHDSNQSTAQSLQEFGSNTTYTAASTTATVTAGDPPYNTVRPTISGTVAVGETLAAGMGTWNANPAIPNPGGYTYQWQQCTSQVGVTSTFASLLSNSPPAPPNAFPEYVRLDPSDNLFSGNRDTNNISKLTPAGTVVDRSGATVTYPFTWAQAGLGPFGMALDSAGNVYVANRNATTITKADIGGTTTTLVSAANPANVAVDSNGNVYAANFAADSVSKFLPGATTPTQTFTVANGVNFDEPFGMAFDSSDNLYLVDRGRNRVVKITPAGVTSVFATIETGGDRLGIAVDAGGNVYVGSGTNPGRVQKFLPNGTQAGGNWPVPIPDPQDVAIGPDGNIYVSRGPAGVPGSIFRITPAGIATEIGATGNWPLGIDFDAAGNIYVANRDSSTITKVTTMTCSDIAGATAANYTLQAGDAGKQLRVKVTAANGVSPSSSAFSAITTGPKEIGAPAISGTTAVGQTLTTSRGLWSASPAIPDPAGYSYRWQRCQSNAVAGDTWVARTTPANEWYGMEWGGPAGDRKFVAVARDGDGNRAMTSPDGITWTPRSTPDGVNNEWNSVVWGDPPGATAARFVAVARSGSGNRVMTSTDGITWSSPAQPSFVTTNTWRSVTWGGTAGQEQFVAVAQTGAVMTSPDGETWTQRTTAANRTWFSVTWGDPAGATPGQFVAVADTNGSAGAGNRVMTSTDGITWVSRTTPVDNNWAAVTWGGPAGDEKFVAVAYDTSGDTSKPLNRVMTSPDGISWTLRAAPVAANYDAVVWGGIPGQERFVAVADYNLPSNSTTGMVITSPDGLTWTAQIAASYRQWHAVEWGGQAGAETFAAVAYLGGSTDRAMTSAGPGCADIAGATSSTYTLQAADYQKYIRSEVTADNGVDPDGVAYSAISSQIAGRAPTNAGGASLPTITGTATVGSTLTATTGTWTATPAITGYSYQWRRCDTSGANCSNVGTDQDTYTLVSADAGSTIRVQVTATNGVSPDGVATSTQTSAVTEAPTNTTAPSISGTARVGQTLTTTNGVWSATPAVPDPAGYSYQWQRCETASVAGVVWTTRTAPSSFGWRSVVWGGDRFVAVGGDPTYDSSDDVLTSPDGVNWTTRTPAENNYWQSVAYGNGTFVAVSSDGTNRVMTSTDGATWTARSAASADQWKSVTWGGPAGQEKFVAVAEDGSGSRIMTSDNGIVWTSQSQPSGLNGDWRSVTWGDPPGATPGQFVAVAYSGSAAGQVMTSPDGITWVARTSAVERGWYGVTWGGKPGEEKFVAVAFDLRGAGNLVMTSPDGVTWTARTSPADRLWHSVAWGGTAGQETFVAVSDTGAPNQVMTSPDGITWTLRSSSSGEKWRAVAWGGPAGQQQFVSVAYDQPAGGAGANRVMTSAEPGCADIVGATSSTYTLQPADYQKYIRSEVTADNGVDPDGVAYSAISSQIAGQAPTNAGGADLPTITGTATVGETLTASNGTWTATPAITGYTYQWQRCNSSGASCSNISGATNQTYTVASADAGSTIRVQVTATNGVSPDGVATSTQTSAVTEAPTNTTAPSISGTARVGQTLTTTNGVWSATPAVPDPSGYSYQWQRCDAGGTNCTDIGGATSSTYTLQPADYEKYVRSRVTANNGVSPNGVASSPVSSQIAGRAPTNAGGADLPTISGAATIGDTLTATTGTWTATPAITGYTYQWRRCNTSGASCADISGATNQTYTVASADAGSTIRIQVTATNGVSPDGVATSTQTAVVTNTLINVAIPTITGTGQVGQTLTTTNGTWTASPAITGYAYRWQRCDQGAPVSSTFAGTGTFPRGIAVASTGYVYTANSADNDVTRISAGGHPTTPFGGPTGTSPSAIAVDAAGNVYTANADGNNVTKIATGGTPTTPLSITGSAPYAIAVDSAGNVYTANSASNNVTKITAGGTPTTLGTTGSSPLAIVVDSAGNVYTADSGSNTVTRITPGGASTTLGATGSSPRGVALDAAGNVYTANHNANTVTRITPAGVSTTLGTTGSSPRGIAVDTAGNVYTANSGSNNVTRITPAGVSTTLGATGNSPSAIALDSAGNVFTANTSSNDVTRIGIDCSDISGATSQTYTLQTPDAGKFLRVTVTAANAGGSLGVGSSPTAEIAPEPQTAPISSGTVPPIGGTTTVGSTLTAAPGTWTANPTPTFTYQWQRCDADGTNCVDIAGANTSNYTLTADDTGKKLQAVITATNTVGSAIVVSPQTNAVNGPPVNRALPTITGTPQENETLTADPGAWIASPAISGYSYQWRRCDAAGANCTDIGTNQNTYTLVAADNGTRIRVLVTATNTVGSANATSAPTTAVIPAQAPTNTGGIPPITGPATVGSTLTAAPGTWTGTPPPTITYQWQRCDADGANCTPISGQTGQTYELTAADTGKKIQVAVTGTNTAGTGGAASSAVVESPATVVISGPPVNQALPIITGTFQEKETLTAGPGAWIASPAPTFAYQWQRCNSSGASCAPISGATGVTYTLTAEDTGKRIRVVSTATNSAGSASATSDPTGVVAPEPATAPINAGGSLPIDGTAEVGQTLTATDGTWDANPAPTFTYQWLRCDSNGDNCTPITGATGQTYIPTSADDDATLRVVVTATNSIGSGSRISAPTAPVVPASTSAPTNTTLPSISGTAKVGQTLSATSGTWSAAPAVRDPSGYTYQWQRCEDAAGTNCSDVAGATNSTYTLGAADLDTYLRVRVTASNGVAPDGVAFSAPSPQVASADPSPSPGPEVTITSVRAVQNNRIVVRVEVNEPGRIRVAGSYPIGTTRTRIRACIATRTVTTAGTYRLSCTLLPRTRARLTARSLRIDLRVTLTTQDRRIATATHTIGIKRHKPYVPPVTG